MTNLRSLRYQKWKLISSRPHSVEPFFDVARGIIKYSILKSILWNWEDIEISLKSKAAKLMEVVKDKSGIIKKYS